MTGRAPHFDEFVGTEVSASERERLRGVHELLVQAGPPPELSPELEAVPWPEEALAPLGLVRRSPQRKRSWLLIASAAAALLLVGFLIGQTAGSRSGSFAIIGTVKMHGVAAAPTAFASIEIGRPGTDGNWPMLVTVSNLPSLQNGGYYDLWLSQHGRPIALCGSFNTKPGIRATVIRMSAAYSFSGIDGWIVTRHLPGAPESRPQLVLST